MASKVSPSGRRPESETVGVGVPMLVTSKRA
jgi:hypothetical protein